MVNMTRLWLRNTNLFIIAALLFMFFWAYGLWQQNQDLSVKNKELQQTNAQLITQIQSESEAWLTYQAAQTALQQKVEQRQQRLTRVIKQPAIASQANETLDALWIHALEELRREQAQ